MIVQSKKFSIVCYDSTILLSGLEYCKNNLPLLSYAYILHNLDLQENGELKKEHYHLYIEFNNRVSDSVLRKLFNTEIVQVCKNMQGYICYMIHLYNPEKTQYKKDNIISFNLNIEDILNSIYGTLRNDNQVLLCLIDNILGMSFYEAFQYALNNNMVSIYKEYYFIIKDIIRENRA